MNYRAAMLAAGKVYWEGLLQKHGNNIAAAAAEAGVHRPDVYKHLKRFGVQIERPQRNDGRWQEMGL